MAIDFTEMMGSPVESWDINGFNATRTLKTAWGTRIGFMAELLSFPGEPYPHHAGANVTRVGARPFAKETGTGGGSDTVYDHAIVTVEYGTRQAIEGTSFSFEPSAEFMKLDAVGFSWDENQVDKLTVGEAPSQQIHGGLLVAIKHNLESPPVGDIALMGSSNLNGLVAMGINFPSETLLFKPPSFASSRDTDGEEVWTVTYRFLVRPQGWNTTWRKDRVNEGGENIGPGWANMFYKGRLYKPYPPMSWDV